MMHGQTDDAVGQLMGIGQILRTGTFQSTVGGKGAYQRIEKELLTNEKLKGVIRDLKKNLT